jgi:hypothetical protein
VRLLENMLEIVGKFQIALQMFIHIVCFVSNFDQIKVSIVQREKKNPIALKDLESKQQSFALNFILMICFLKASFPTLFFSYFYFSK